MQTCCVISDTRRNSNGSSSYYLPPNMCPQTRSNLWLTDLSHPIHAYSDPYRLNGPIREQDLGSKGANSGVKSYFRKVTRSSFQPAPDNMPPTLT